MKGHLYDHAEIHPKSIKMSIWQVEGQSGILVHETLHVYFHFLWINEMDECLGEQSTCCSAAVYTCKKSKSALQPPYMVILAKKIKICICKKKNQNLHYGPPVWWSCLAGSFTIQKACNTEEALIGFLHHEIVEAGRGCHSCANGIANIVVRVQISGRVPTELKNLTRVF